MKIISGDTIFEPTAIRMIDRHLIVYRAIKENKNCINFRAIYCTDKTTTKTMFDVLRTSSLLDLDVVCEEWDFDETPLLVGDGVITITKDILSGELKVKSSMIPISYKGNSPENREKMEISIQGNKRSLFSLGDEFIF